MEGYGKNNGDVGCAGNCVSNVASSLVKTMKQCDKFSWIFIFQVNWMNKAVAIRNESVHTVMNLMSINLVHQRKMQKTCKYIGLKLSISLPFHTYNPE